MKRRDTLKNKILKTITSIAAVGAIFFACGMDSVTWDATNGLCACLVWLFLFSWANNWWHDEEDIDLELEQEWR